MTTFVGSQNHFKDAVKSLIELDYDAVEAYESAINRLDNTEYKNKLREFKKDHERHIKELSELIRKYGDQPPTGPDIKQVLTKGKVVLADIVGDDAILRAMLDNEKDTNKAYKTMLERSDQWADSKDILRRGAEDERKHKEWLQSAIAKSL